MGIILSTFTATSCLDNEDMDFVPKAIETNNPHYGKDGDNDSIPPPAAPPTGGQIGQNPVKP